MGNNNPLEIAKKVGYSLGGNIGELAFTELELAYATKLLPRFSDDPITRVVQNVILYWQRGYYKSTSLKVFSQTIPKVLKTTDITSMTLEKIFGSISERKKHILDPAFTNDVYFVVISELTALLGQRDAMRQFSNVMNVVLEGEKVSRQILKLGYGEISEEELKEHEEKGVFYDPIRGELSYTPNVCVLAATRPLVNRYFTYLSNSGHFGRYHVVQYRVTAEDASEHLHKDYKLDQEALKQLTEINLLLSRVKVNKMLRPSESLMKPIYDNLEALVRDEIAERPRLELADVINPRLKDDIIRELVAHAFLRTAPKNGFKNIDELHYTQEDVDFVQNRLSHFVDFTVNPLIAKAFTPVSKRKPKIEICMEAILECLSDGQWHSPEEIISFGRSRFREIGREVGQATIYNALKRLEILGKIDHQYGRYRIAGGKEIETS
jgi:hypothetical protein